MRNLTLWLSISLMLIVMPIITFAQDQDDSEELITIQEEPILLQMLRHIPALPANRNNLYFMDRSAIEIAYPDVMTPANFDELEELERDSGWFKVIMNTFMPTAQYMMQMGTMPDSIGIHYFDIDQELLYGVPPSAGLILQGEFDTESIQNAFANRNYQQVGDGDLWCLEGDCTSGTFVNLETRDTANPFGGHLGRNEPVVIRENWISGSTSPSQLSYDTSGKAFMTYPMSELPDIIDTVNAVYSLGTVLQVSMWEGMTLGSANNAPELLNNPDIDLSRFGIDDSLGEIGFYSMALFADVVTEDEQIAVIAFAFLPQSAESSLEELVYRLETMSSISTGQRFSDLLEQRQATISTEMYQGEMYTIGLLKFSTPKMTYDELTQPVSEVETTPPSMLYQFLQRMITMRDTLWMSFDPLIITD
jgi:hypothetical protein